MAKDISSLSTEVELSLSAKKLKNKDTLSKSDPVCIVSIRDDEYSELREAGRTEQIKDTLDPEWITKIKFEFKFEEKQVLLLSVYDWDKKSDDHTKQDLIGNVECTLGEIMALQDTQISKELSKKGGTILITGKDASSCKEIATIIAAGENLDKKDTFGKSDPFLVFTRCEGAGKTLDVATTEVVKSNLNPEWEPIEVPLDLLCEGKYDSTFKIFCYDWDSNGKHDLIGECILNVDMIRNQTTTPLINPKKGHKVKYKNSGMLNIKIQKIVTKRSFLDYLREGLQLHFTVAVDFTASNKDPRDPNSLHYWGDGGNNFYSSAIRAVGEIIQDYDSDKAFPSLGFGARIPPDMDVSHEFFLNGSQDNPYCNGIQGILDAYKHALQTVVLHGPTNFSPVIRHIANFAEKHTDGKHYFVLLIITDGIISDMANTLRTLIEISSLPISIIIIGVGTADFAAMNFIDSDDRRITYEGKFATRDIVQFVEMNQFVDGDGKVCHKTLAASVLKEIPQQVASYMNTLQ